MRIYIVLILLCISCSGTRNSGCDENLKFKKEFFNHIEYIEKNISVLQDSTFIKSVIFISNYAPVSHEEIMNYARSYSIGIFEQDKVKWIKWYEENRCSNIQFKTSYTIPEVYKD